MTAEQIKAYNLEFNEPTGDSYFNSRKIDICLGNISCSIERNDSVYSRDSWGRYHSTTKIWALESDYKIIRYSSLHNAVVKAIEKLDNMMAEKNARLEKEDEESNAEFEMKKFAESNGFEFSKDYHYSRNRHSTGYYTYSMKKKNVSARLSYSREDRKVSIISYTVTDKNITVEEINRI